MVSSQKIKKLRDDLSKMSFENELDKLMFLITWGCNNGVKITKKLIEKLA